MHNTEQSNRYLYLSGYFQDVIKRHPRAKIMRFVDDFHGPLVCIIPSTCILFYNLERDKKHHLEVALKGELVFKKSGWVTHRNNLVVTKLLN